MRLLLAEDEKSLSRALVKLLESSNYSVDAAYDGEEALDYLAVSNYDAVILDLMMPKVDGLTVLRTMRERNDLTPVLILTARSEIDDKVQGLDSGANDYLTKPFDIKELMARIRAITRIHTNAAASVLHFSNISLNRFNFSLSSDESSVRLTNKEFQMLELLMSNAGQVIPTSRLFDRIWGLDSESDISIVWVYISYIRRKLRSINAKVKIQAIRNVGYSLLVAPGGDPKTPRASHAESADAEGAEAQEEAD